MVQKTNNELEVNKPAYMYYLTTKSGQCSPTSDALDSGTGSDLETTPTPNGNGQSTDISTTSPSSLSNAVSKSIRKFSDLSIELTNGQQHRLKSRSTNDSYNTDSEESESSLSCDSLNSAEVMRLKNKTVQLKSIRASPIIVSATPRTPPSVMSPGQGTVITSDENNVTKINFLPHSLLRDIRDRSMTIIKTQSHANAPADVPIDGNNTNGRSSSDAYPKQQQHVNKTITMNDQSDCSATYTHEPFNLHQRHLKNHVNETNEYCDALFAGNKSSSNSGVPKKLSACSENRKIYENDKYINFHLNERVLNAVVPIESKSAQLNKDDDTFAGYKDIAEPVAATSTIRSSKGTIRGVKNRVRNGIATFLQMHQTNVKNYKEKDSGKVVLYSTSMGIVRETYAKCANVKQILRTLLIKFEERDVFMSSEYQQEIKDRMQSVEIQVPQLFVDGQHIGNADQVERLNESGELRQMLKIYKSLNSSYTCQICGGYRLLPCPSCSGSKKSVHRNHFTTEFVALKCMNCDEVGLVKCYNCN